MQYRTFLLVALFMAFFQSNAQNEEKKQFTVKYTQDTITIDAVLDEPVWSLAEPATNFWQYFPTDSLQSKQQTEIRMLFNDKFLYVGIKLNSSGKDYIVPSL